MSYVEQPGRSHKRRIAGPRPGAIRGSGTLSPPFLLLVLGLVVCSGSNVLAEGTIEQQFVLHPGWNAIFLEVQPVVDDMELALAAVPVKSVWSWNPPASDVGFIQDPADQLFDIPGWQHFVPPPRPDSLLNSLFLLQANRAYLINLDGSVPVIWRVRGRPKLSPLIRWKTDSFTLTGLKVDAASPPTFGAYFSPSEAHDGQPIFRLDTSGVWQVVGSPETTPIQSGEAYWVFTRGASKYQGPLELGQLIGGALDFGAALDFQGLVIRNRSEWSTSLRISRLDQVHAVPLVVRQSDEDDGTSSWPLLPPTLTLDSSPGQEHLLDLGVRRAALPLDVTESVLEIKNDLGIRILCPVSAASLRDRTGEGVSTFGTTGAHESSPAPPLAASSDISGLWAGEVTVTSISESQMGGTTPTPVGQTLSFRILLHLDSSGQVRLLKEVIQMWQNGTMVPDPEDPDFLITDEPGRYVLLTDDSLIPSYEGASLRDGVPVGFRVSTAAYDFPGQWVVVEGNLELGGNLTWSLVLDSEFPTNPFRHKYHPDHDNLDERFLNFREEAYIVTREMQLQFAGGEPTSADPPGWGNTILGGTFRESISGLHRNTIFVEGTFTLTRLTATPVLNQ